MTASVKCWLGIDPGLSGAIGIYWPAMDCVDAEDIPVAGGMVDVVTLANIFRQYLPDRAVIERVNSMPGQGVSSTFKFGCAFGSILGIFGAMKIPYALVAPTKWKRHFGLGSDKDASRAWVLSRFPKNANLFQRKRDHNRAEAVLLALYGAEMDRADRMSEAS